jgi:hypothetical protein
MQFKRLCLQELPDFIANRYASEHLTNLGIIAGFLVMMVGLISRLNYFLQYYYLDMSY